MYARNARGASGYPNAFASGDYPHFNYPDDTKDNDYYGTGDVSQSQSQSQVRLCL